MLIRQGQRLLQAGIALLLFTSFEGFFIPLAASPRIALSAHTLAGLQAALLLAEGLFWPRLALGATAARIAFWCSLFATIAILAAYLVAAITGVGVETISLAGELPHGLHHGSVPQETAIKILAYSSAPTGIAAFALMPWGLRSSRSRTEKEKAAAS